MSLSTADIWVDWELLIASKDDELGVIVSVGDKEYDERTDRGSAAGSSESEPAGVRVGGGLAESYSSCRIGKHGRFRFGDIR